MFSEFEEVFLFCHQEDKGHCIGKISFEEVCVCVSLSCFVLSEVSLSAFLLYPSTNTAEERGEMISQHSTDLLPSVETSSLGPLNR